MACSTASRWRIQRTAFASTTLSSWSFTGRMRNRSTLLKGHISSARESSRRPWAGAVAGSAIAFLEELHRCLNREQVLVDAAGERLPHAGFNGEARAVFLGGEVDQVQSFAAFAWVQPINAALEFCKEGARRVVFCGQLRA